MKIIVLSKRAPQQRDLWTRPYGRFYHLAKGLAELDCQVDLVLLDYSGSEVLARSQDGFQWHTVPLIPNPLFYYCYVKKLAIDTAADWLIGCSDTWFGICAERVARAVGSHSLIDAYDNYESYIPWLVPLHFVWRRALRRASALTAAGPGLLQYIVQGEDRDFARVIEMAADPVFSPRTRSVARRRLRLPADKKIIAYIGSLHRNRAIDELLAVFSMLQSKAPEIQVVLSGFREPGLKLPENCLHLGYVDDGLVIELLASANVVLCANKPDRFGTYSYPVKVYEALAMGVPVVAFSTPSLDYVMRTCAQNLVPYPDTVAMAERCIELVSSANAYPPSNNSWLDRSKELLQMMRAVEAP